MNEKKILIIDDHREFRETLRNFIEKKFGNARLSEASSGEEGVDLAVKERSHVALIDIYLPVMDGLETAAKIKKSLPDCQIITMSMFKNRKVFITQEVDAFIEKNELEDKLIQLLHVLLDDH